jgi:hypothetical protein
MKLDRNSRGDGRGKYGLIKNRRLEEILGPIGPSPQDPTDPRQVRDALNVLAAAGVLDWGDKPETEFFVMRLRDRFSHAALNAYAMEAEPHDLEYAQQVASLCDRAGLNNPSCKDPD